MLGAAVTAFGAACDQPRQASTTSSATGPTTGGDLTVSVRAEPRSFCSCVTPEATTYLVTLLTQAKLVRVNPATEDIEPWLADNWTRSDDGLRYVIKLKPNVRFSDGAPLTADDVAFSLAAAYDPASAIADSLQVLGKKLQATVMDPLTVAIAFPSPFGPGLRVLDDLPILPKHKLEGALSSGRFGAAWSVTTPVKEIVGLGPFVIADYRPGERLVFARNSHYFRTDDRGAHLPYLDRIIVEIVPDQDAQALKLEAGDTDTEASEIRPEDYAPLKRAAEHGSIQLLDLGVRCRSRRAVDQFASQRVRARPETFLDSARRITTGDFRCCRSPAVCGHDISRRRDAGLWTNHTLEQEVVFRRKFRGPRTTSRVRNSCSPQIGLVDRNQDGFVEDSSGTPARLTLLTMKGQTALERGADVIREELEEDWVERRRREARGKCTDPEVCLRQGIRRGVFPLDEHLD